jgi:hypothetical protein
VEGLSAAGRLIEVFAPRHAGIGQGACLSELTSTDLLQCADSAHWMVTGAECDRGGRCAADPAATPARSWLTDRGAIAGSSPIIRHHAIRGVENVSRPNRDNVDAVKSHLELRSEGATTVAFDTTIIEISLLR